MKLRIRGSSLRLRLSQGEVADAITFPGGARLTYRVSADVKLDEISSSYENNLIEIRIPEKLVAHWCGTDLVTLSGAQPTASGELRFAVEKDFACLAPRQDEDESDHFPHPRAGSGETC